MVGRWDPLPGGGGTAGALVGIDEVELASSAASISFSSIPSTYKDLVLVGELRTDRSGATADPLNVQVGNGSVDTGANYRYTKAEMDETSSLNSFSTEGQTAVAGPNAAGAGADAGIYTPTEIQVLRYADSSRYRHIITRGSLLSDLDDMRTLLSGGAWENTSDVIDIITFTAGFGSFVAGSYLTLYGRGTT